MFQTDSIIFSTKAKLVTYINSLLENANTNFNIQISSKFELGQFSTNIVLVNYKNSGYSSLSILGEKITAFIKEMKHVTNARLEQNGFINFSFDQEYLLQNLNNVDIKLSNSLKIYIEYVSANPTGPLHIGHIRGAVVGDVIARFFEYLKCNTKKEYFVNDAGNQINDLLDSVIIRCEEIIEGKPKQLKPNCYPGSYVIDIAKNVLKKYPDQYNNKEIIQNYVVENVLEDIFTNLKKVNIHHNSVISEKSFFDNNIQHDMNLFQYKYLDSGAKKTFQVPSILQDLENQEYIYYGKLPRPKEDQNWVDRTQLLFKASLLGDDQDSPLTKANGDYTYFASEICYIKYKIMQNFDKYIIILGQDHIGYVKKYNGVFNMFKQEGQENTVKISANVRYLENNEVKIMSKRAGVFATLNDVLDIISPNAIRYFLLQNREGTIIDFDLTKAKDNNNHLSYIHNLYTKLDAMNNQADAPHNLSSQELKLICFIQSWPLLIENVYKKLEVNLIINYLYDLACLTNLVLNEPGHSRQILLASRSVLKKCYQILGFVY